MVALNERKIQNNESASGQKNLMRNYHDPLQILHWFSYIILIQFLDRLLVFWHTHTPILHSMMGNNIKCKFVQFGVWTQEL